MLSFLAKKFGSSVGVTPPPAPTFAVPNALPKLSAKNGAELMKLGGFDKVAGAPDPATQSTAQFLKSALNERQDVVPATKALANGLPEKERLKWAIDSCEKVKDQLPEPEQRALIAAGDYFADPSPVNQELARRAAEQSGFKGPAGFTAKAASLSSLTPAKPLPPVAKAELAKEVAPKAPDVVGTLVAGAVMLAATMQLAKAAKPEPEKAAAAPSPAPEVKEIAKAAIPAPPAPKPAPGSKEAVQAAQAFKPFLEKGLALAAG